MPTDSHCCIPGTRYQVPGTHYQVFVRLIPLSILALLSRSLLLHTAWARQQEAPNLGKPGLLTGAVLGSLSLSDRFHQAMRGSAETEYVRLRRSSNRLKTSTWYFFPWVTHSTNTVTVSDGLGATLTQRCAARRRNLRAGIDGASMNKQKKEHIIYTRYIIYIYIYIYIDSCRHRTGLHAVKALSCCGPSRWVALIAGQLRD